MAWRLLAKEAVAPLRRSIFTSLASPPTSSSSRRPYIANAALSGRYGVPKIWSHFSGSASARNFRTIVGERTLFGIRSQSSGIKLLKGFGIASFIGTMLYTANVAHAIEERPSNIIGPSGYLKHEISTMWSLVKKYQLPSVLLLMIALGWRNPIALVINILLLLYCTRPNPYSIYLFLQQFRQREMRQNPELWNDEFLYTRKVDTEDYKLFSLGRVELTDKTILHVIGILGGWDMAGRNIGVAVDFSSCSRAALRWASINLARNGDRLILIHVNSSYQNEQGVVHLWEQSGSPLIPLVEFLDPRVNKTYGVSPDKETLEILTQVANQSGIEVLAKIFWGDPAKKLHEAIDKVPLHCLVVGNRGLSPLKRALMGSVSTYVLNHATCPVTVVKENI